ncbi:MAG TPA: hypothetical protein VMZ31_01175 [Phycisphaerae bacterium]|nr:hypothetical protein [Phycisphaerae bacterium]
MIGRSGSTGRVHRRGVMLAAVLVIVVLLSILGLSFGFSMRANLLATGAVTNELQARLAAEAGVQRLIQLMRAEGVYVSAWLNNPDNLHEVLVWSPQQEEAPSGFEHRSESTRSRRDDRRDDEEQPDMAWRFSIVADDPSDDEERVRFGVVPENGKLDINMASQEQLTALFSEVLDPLEVVVPELVDALLDWRDADDEPRENGAENDFYVEREPVGYRAKNGAFETVEELLLVKGFTAQVLFGEDYNRNGLLEANENDGDASFPLDNADGELDRGLLPYLTVWSRELNLASDGRPRFNLGSGGGRGADAAAEQLAEFFEPEAVDYILGAGAAGEGETNSPVRLVLAEDSPLTVEDLPAVLDRITTLPYPGFMGLINVNTAPQQVLATIPELAPYVDDILAVRDDLDDEAKLTPAWLHTDAAVPLEVLAELVGARPDYGVTTRASVISIESLGYADHVGVVKRINVVLDISWPTNPQVLYYRDLTPLGTAYRIREMDHERVASSFRR